MKIDVTFRNMEHTVAIEDHVQKHASKFAKYLAKENPEATFIHVVLDGQLKHHKYNAEVRVKTPHYNLVVNREGKDMYPLIDEVMHIMEEQLQQAKRKMVDSLKKNIKISKL